MVTLGSRQQPAKQPGRYLDRLLPSDSPPTLGAQCGDNNNYVRWYVPLPTRYIDHMGCNFTDGIFWPLAFQGRCWP